MRPPVEPDGWVRYPASQVRHALLTADMDVHWGVTLDGSGPLCGSWNTDADLIPVPPSEMDDVRPCRICVTRLERDLPWAIERTAS